MRGVPHRRRIFPQGSDFVLSVYRRLAVCGDMFLDELPYYVSNGGTNV